VPTDERGGPENKSVATRIAKADPGGKMEILFPPYYEGVKSGKTH